ncbi:MAG: M20/M25/M40 family metallo-hydrolase [Thermoanaerobaculia bacterium]
MRTCLLFTILFSFQSFTPLVADAAEVADRAAIYRSWVGTLSHDSMEGRGVGTEGLGRAAAWIEENLRESGLEPAFLSGYRQRFRIKTGVELASDNRLEGVAREDWTPLGFSSSEAFEGELAFAGYGIEAPPIGYQELEGVDLRGKVVLMLRYEPQERDEASPFDGKRPSRWSATRYKVHQARERGAAAVVFVTGPLQDDGDKIPVLRNDGPESPAGIPVIQIRTSVAQRWLAPLGIDLLEFQNSVDRDLAPRSKGATGIRIRGEVDLDTTWADAENVAGVIPGRGSLAGEIVVVGAHYDHLGWGGTGSMRPNEKAIHNGADDNASGTAAVLLAARQLHAILADVPERRTIMIALFSGEEVGLAGSGHMVQNFPRPIENVVAMVNLDMVGRLREGKLAALGTDSAPEWAGLITRLATPLGIEAASSGDGYGPSDQTSFFAAGIPVVHFFTGTHDAYHTPEDDVETINAEGGAAIAELTAGVAAEIARGNVTPSYERGSAAPVMSGDSRGYGAYLGTVPDYRAMSDTTGGVLLSDVRTGGPGELAGIRGGDRIIAIAGTKIENLYDMTFALQDNRPGETIDVVVLRDGKEITLRATLGSRAERAAPVATPATPAAAPVAAPAMPPAGTPSQSPHGMAPAAEAEAGFYANRPGRDFAIGAGKPFVPRFEGEKHFTDIRQLTFGGENAEAYFSPDGTKLIYQATLEKGSCDQQYVLDLTHGAVTRVSSGKGRTTCGYFDYPEGDRVVFASTEGGGEECPPPPDFSAGYVWATYPTFDLWEAGPDGSGLRRIDSTPGYDAELTWCHRGGKFLFTSTRDGDLDLYESDEAGNVKRLTDEPGYDGGAFYNADCTEIVWRASRPEGEELADYRRLLAQNLIRPGALEIFVMSADGTGKRQVTSNGAANFGPYFHPGGQKIIYASNAGANEREFDLWMVSREGGEPSRVTTAPGFDGFPMFSPDGEWIVWASNRADPAGSETNLYIARWVE